MMICEFCKNSFSSKTNLKNHQKSAKYCIALRKNSVENDVIYYTCKTCNKQFSRKFNLVRHEEKCVSIELFYELKNKLDKYAERSKIDDDKIKFLEEQLHNKDLRIKELEQQMLDVTIKAVSKSTTTNKTNITNYIQQLQPLTDQHLTDNVQHLTIDHIMKGPEGYAQYALEYPLKDRMICVDYARRKVKFKDKDGKVITDPEMTSLATKFFNSIKDKNKELILECSDKLKENFGDEVDTIVKILDYKSAVDNCSEGEKSEFNDGFVKYMCSQTIKE